jgi:hypothetical protein
MFRAACDNSVTTSPPTSPPIANPDHPKCPPAQPMCTKPDRADPRHCPTTASGSSQGITTPLPSAPPTLRHRAVSFTAPTRHARACRPQHQCTFRAARPPHRFTVPDPDMSKVTTCPANTARPPTMPMRGRQRRPIPSHRRSPRTAPPPDSPRHRVNVDPP